MVTIGVNSETTARVTEVCAVRSRLESVMETVITDVVLPALDGATSANELVIAAVLEIFKGQVEFKLGEN